MDLGHLSMKEKRFVVRSSLNRQTKCTHILFSITAEYVHPSQDTPTEFTFSSLLLMSSSKQCITDLLNKFCTLCAVPVGHMKVNPV